MANAKKLMMSAAGGGGDFLSDVVSDNNLIEGNFSGTYLGSSVPQGSLRAVQGFGSHILSDGTMVGVYDNRFRKEPYIVKYDTDGTALVWKSVTNTTGGSIDFRVYDSCVDSSDNLYLSGVVSNYNLAGYGGRSKGGVIKIDTSGNMSLTKYWVYPQDENNDNNGTSLHYGCSINQNNGNLMVCGRVDISGTGAVPYYMELNPSTGAIVLDKYISDGGSIAWKMDTDTSGNVYLCGYHSNNPDAVWKLNSSGTTQWAKSFKSNGSTVQDIKVKGSYVYVVPTNSDGLLSGFAYRPLTVYKLNASNGSHAWTTANAHADSSEAKNFYPRKLSFDSNGDILVLWEVPAAWVIDQGTLYSQRSCGIARLEDSTGNLDWAVSIHGYSNSSYDTSQTENDVQLTLEEDAIDCVDGRIAVASIRNNFYWQRSGTYQGYVNQETPYIANLPEDLSGYSFQNGNTFSTLSITTTDFNQNFNWGMGITDVTSYFNLSGNISPTNPSAPGTITGSLADIILSDLSSAAVFNTITIDSNDVISLS
jgi:hypothetical protein